MAEQLPPNTHDLDVRVRVTLPAGETVEQQDIALLLTGEDFDPWPGVEIHDVELLGSRPADKMTDLFGERRFGFFSFDADLIRTAPTELMRVMGPCIIVRAEHHYASRHIEYMALSPAFDALPEGEAPPRYDLLFERLRNGGLTFHFERRR